MGMIFFTFPLKICIPPLYLKAKVVVPCRKLILASLPSWLHKMLPMSVGAKGGVKTFMGSSALGNEAIISSLASNSSWSNNLFSPKTERLGAPHK